MDTNSIPSKRCSRCKLNHPATTEYFYRSKQTKDGFYAYCKQCSVARVSQYAKDHPDYANNKAAKWRDLHKDQVKDIKKRWCRENPERAILYTSRRRAHKLSAIGSHTPTDIDILYINQRGLCAYCDSPLLGKYHVDHIVPLSRGGNDYAENLTLTCAPCNLSKGDKLLTEWSAPNTR